MIWEIVLVTVGIAAIAAGYLIPAKKDESNKEIENFSREQVQTMVAEEMETAKGQISDIVDETITYAIEKTERSMDRISNEKMMAVSEYSDTVLDQINKNHEEVVFLYDMLNDKHENLKDTVAEAQKAASDVKAKIKEAEEIKPILPVAQPAASAPVPSFEEKSTSSSFVDFAEAEQNNSEVEDTFEPIEIEKPKKKTKAKKEAAIKPVPVIKAPAPVVEETEFFDDDEEILEEEWDDFDSDEDEENEGPVISFNSRSPGSRNSNERILELHKAGKSNMAIAKELGLGVGEVKLVIDLFKGM